MTELGVPRSTFHPSSATGLGKWFTIFTPANGNKFILSCHGAFNGSCLLVMKKNLRCKGDSTTKEKLYHQNIKDRARASIYSCGVLNPDLYSCGVLNPCLGSFGSQHKTKEASKLRRRLAGCGRTEPNIGYDTSRSKLIISKSNSVGRKQNTVWLAFTCCLK